VDPRTARLFGALKRPGAALLLRLLEGPATEAELIEADPAATQPTANRRLAQLEELGVIERDPGEPHAPGRSWRLTFAEEVDALVTTANDLSESLARREEALREETRRRLRRSRAHRRLRDVSDGKG
jgi:DNA-binding HxlR family transcriptional regulator